MFSFLILSLVALTTALPTTDVLPRAASKPYQIRGVQAPIYHLYLQSLPSNKSEAVMGPEATGEFFDIGTTIQSKNSSLYLNIGTSSASYKPLSLDTTSSTTAWALEGDTIITSQGSSYGRQLNFLICPAATSGYFDLFLQTGSDTPSGKSCSNYQTIHLPCLC